MKLRADRSGFALPMAILVIGFMTAGVLAAFARTGAEVQIVDNQAAETRAYANAERGLGDYLAIGKPPQTSYDSVNYVYPDGGATVIVRLMRDRAAPTEEAVWLVRSRGTVRTQSGRPLGERTVAQLAFGVLGQMDVLSSWTSLNGLNKSGNAGSISGFDACTSNSVAGVAVPNGMLSGQTDPITGTPLADYLGSTVDDLKAKINIDWEAITDTIAPAIQADYTVCRQNTVGYSTGHDLTRCGAWPTSFTDWPIIFVNGSLTPNLPSDGQGMLIVSGDLDIGGNQFWDGIILVGGRIHDKGNGGINGAVVSGLNILLGETVGVSIMDDASGTKDYQFDSCAIQNAMTNMSRMLPIENAWVDNWKTW